MTRTAANPHADDTATAEITVGAAGGAPVASFTYMPETPVVGQEIAFTDTSSGMPESWEWSFGDGGTVTMHGTSQASPHVAGAAGTNWSRPNWNA